MPASPTLSSLAALQRALPFPLASPTANPSARARIAASASWDTRKKQRKEVPGRVPNTGIRSGLHLLRGVISILRYFCSEEGHWTLIVQHKDQRGME